MACSKYRRAADHQVAPGISAIGRLHSKGLGVPKNRSLAVEWLQKGADAGDYTAFLDLGTLYAEGGDGRKPDGERAALMYRKAAAAGEAGGWYGLGWMYSTGKGVAQDDAVAYGWFMKAAQAGYPAAQVMVGRMNLIGRGTAKNFKDGGAWLRRSAEAGDAKGQTILGRLYLWGKPLGLDDAEGIRWLSRAAIGGATDAQYWLAEAYLSGDHVKQDLSRGFAWMRIAAVKGNENAKSRMDQLGFKLSLEQLGRGIRAAATWRAGVDLTVERMPVGGMAFGQFNLNAPFAPGG
ncbi:tetratricopeptide repeat protein [Ralstonia pseudosolanacearum]